MFISFTNPITIASSIAGDAAVRMLTTETVKQIESYGIVLATRSNVNDIEAMALTKDEFLAEGLKSAEMAEHAGSDLNQAQTALDRAIWCFEQAGDNGYASKARAHRRSIRFRLSIDSRTNIRDRDRLLLETKAAQLAENLVKEGLVQEVLSLYYSSEPILSSYTKEHLDKWLMTKLKG